MLMLVVWMSLAAIPRPFRTSIRLPVASLLAERASLAEPPWLTTPTLISAMSGAAEIFPVPLTEIVGGSWSSSADRAAGPMRRTVTQAASAIRRLGMARLLRTGFVGEGRDGPEGSAWADRIPG